MSEEKHGEFKREPVPASKTKEPRRSSAHLMWFAAAIYWIGFRYTLRS